MAAFGILLLILDARTAIDSARDGVSICLRAVIPSLFPFLVLSCILTSSLWGTKSKILRPIGKLCGVPEGAESLLLLGFLGGYPVGAQSVSDAYHRGYLSKSAAERLLGFCNNAGPSFIFGILGVAFSSKSASWALWLIHIGSAVIVGMLLPGKNKENCVMQSKPMLSLPKALERSLGVMATICGWVVAFRVILGVLDRWIFWILPAEIRVLLTGILELSNGCLALCEVTSEGTRFVLSSLMLALGGLCVGMQTVSVTGKLGTGMYFHGKIMQSLLSFLLAMICQYFLFSNCECLNIPPIAYVAVVAVSGILYYWIARKKVVAICA